MSKEITEDILRKAGFYMVGISPTSFYRRRLANNGVIDVYASKINEGDVPWYTKASRDGNSFGSMYTQTIDHFNKFMELMDIDFRLKEK